MTSNCTLDDVISSLKILASLVNFEPWKLDFIEKLAIFVFINGLIEAAGPSMRVSSSSDKWIIS